MFAVNTYNEIEENERILNEKHIVVLLFVRPSLPDAYNIINEFNYIHYNSRKYCSIYAVGYSNNKIKTQNLDFKSVEGICGNEWYYSDEAFIDFKDKLENRLQWKYSGDIELIILQSNPDGKNILNFENYLTIDVNYGIKNNYIESFSRFIELLIRSSKKEVEIASLNNEMNKSKLKIKEIVLDTIEECKKVPYPLRKIIKDRLFYRTSSTYNLAYKLGVRL